MAIDFPASPTLNQLFAADDKLWQWDGVAWTAYLAANNASLHGASHGSAGVDPVTLAQSQVTGLTTSLSGKASTTHAASHASAGSDPITIAQSQVTSLTTDLAAKAPLASPSFTGNAIIGAGASSTLPLSLQVPTGGYNWLGLNSGYTGALSVAINDDGGSGAFGINQYNSSGTFVRRAITVDSAGATEFKSRVDAITTAAAGYGVRVRAGSGDTPAILQFTNNVANTQWASLSVDQGGLISGNGLSLGAWTTFTPTFTGLTVGNGTFVNCAYMQIGKVVTVRIGLIWGSTTAITSVVDVTLPVTARAMQGNPNFGITRYIDANGAQYNGVIVYIGTTAMRFQRSFVSGSEIMAGEVGSGSPFTWTTSDQMHGYFSYEAA